MSLESGKGLDFKKHFATPAAAGTPAAKSDRPKAQYWLNIGYSVTVQTEEGVEQRFISLPSGIPLDTMEELKTNSSNALFAQMQAARNDLFGQLMEKAKELAPGEDKIFGEEGGLQIQLRHVREENAEINPADNAFSRTLKL